MSRSNDLRRRLGSAATSEKETTICCYCGRDGVIAVACIWMLFSSVMVVAASYWIYLVHAEEVPLGIPLPSLTSTDAANGKSATFSARAQKFYSLPPSDWSAILISLIVDSSLNLLMAIILLYGAYYNKKVYYVPWMLKTGFLMLCMVAFGIYNIYLVVAKTENSQEASFWGSLCALFWLIICFVFYCFMSVYAHHLVLRRREARLQPSQFPKKLMPQNSKFLKIRKLRVTPFQGTTQ